MNAFDEPEDPEPEEAWEEEPEPLPSSREVERDALLQIIAAMGITIEHEIDGPQCSDDDPCAYWILMRGNTKIGCIYVGDWEDGEYEKISLEDLKDAFYLLENPLEKWT